MYLLKMVKSMHQLKAPQRPLQQKERLKLMLNQKLKNPLIQTNMKVSGTLLKQA
jgi:hypothetical protein